MKKQEGRAKGMDKEIITDFFLSHREEYLKDLAELISIDSSKGDPEPGMPFGRGPAKALDTVF